MCEEQGQSWSRQRDVQAVAAEGESVVLGMSAREEAGGRIVFAEFSRECENNVWGDVESTVKSSFVLRK